LDATQLSILAAGGLFAGVVNTLAGGGSLLTVGLLVFLGLPGTIANGTNRVGVLAQNVTSAWRFRAAGRSGVADALPLLVPLLAGSFVGAFVISRVTPEFFEKLFGMVMLLLLVPLLRPGGESAAATRSAAGEPRRSGSRLARFATFFAVGVYGGAIQAGVGIFVLFALSRAGYDLVRANAIKAVLIAALTAVAVPVFVASGQVVWPEALSLGAGFVLGGWIGVRIAVKGGERVIRPVLAVSVVALAARMLGLI
jgi:uncharacterized membrane protein YfcA